MASCNILFIFALCCLFLQINATSASTITSTIYGWGQNNYGQLGIGNAQQYAIPTRLSAYDSLNITGIRLSQGSTFLLASYSQTRCQGTNFYGQLAITPVSSSPTTTAALNAALNTSIEIYPGGNHVVGRLSTTKTLLGWGLDAGYVIGVGGVNSYPKIQSALPSYGFNGQVEQVATAQNATFALLTNGTLWSAGYGGFGVLGQGSTANSFSFQEISYFRQNNITIKSLLTGQSNHTCAIAVNGSLYCWGSNFGGQLGVGDSLDRYYPSRVNFFDDGGYILAKVKLGKTFTVALTCGGSVFSWGTNEYAQQGIGTLDSNSYSTPMQVTGFSTYSIADVEVGSAQVFAQATTGDWFVWGGGGNYALGTNNVLNYAVPTLNPYLKNLTRIFASSTSLTMFGWSGIPSTNIFASCPVLVNECTTNQNTCSNISTCVDTESSYYCKCPSGNVGDGHTKASGGTSCKNPNACMQGNCVSLATCINTEGSSYTCACPNGYYGDGKSTGSGCQDVNECTVGGYCSAAAICTNYAPGYACQCPSGFLGDGYVNGTSCTIECPVGQYASAFNVCSSCPLGSYSDSPNMAACTLCPNGTYNALIGSNSSSACLPCEVGTYSFVGMSFCYPCPYGLTTMSNDVTGLRDSADYCFSCPIGTYGYYGECIQCPTGTFGAAEGMAACTPCPSGTYTNSTGSITCEVCPAGTYALGQSSSCTPCSAGYYNSNPNSTECRRCPAGTSTMNMTGQISCTNCTEGQYQPTIGSKSCLSCPLGSYNDQSGSIACTQCTTGTFANITGSSQCLECPSNAIAPSVSSRSCENCLVGQESSGDSTDCIPCMAGYYRNSSMTSCQTCSPGTYMNVIGSTFCWSCAPGSYIGSYGATFCRKCPLNTYSNAQTGYSSCMACPVGTTSLGGASICS